LRINLKAKTINDKSANFPVIHYNRGGQPVRGQEPHFWLCYRKEPHHTHGHTWTSHHFFTHEHHIISSHMNITQAYKSI